MTIMPRQISVEEYQELGRNYYKLKQYDKALETFTKGIETCPNPTLNLYDYRAATYDKLERFSDAVRDGREMIRMQKSDVKGYLRTASVLENMGKEETALGIYKYGMKNVGSKDKNFKFLQQLHDKLTRKLSPATAVDPFSVLPVELAEMVLEYLPFRHIVNCMRVSKGWRDYLSKLPKLWLHLDLKGARKPVPRSFVSSAFRFSEMRMTHVTLHRLEHMDVIKNLAKMAKGLTDVEILSSPHAMSASLVEIAKSSSKLKKLTVHPDITADAMEQILQARPTLEHVAFHSVLLLRRPMKWTNPFPHLHTLSLTGTDRLSGWQLEIAKLFSLTPSLRSFSLCNADGFDVSGRGWPQDASQIPPITKLAMKRVSFELHPALPNTLQHLILDNYWGLLPRITNTNPWARAKLADLTHLSLSGISVSPEKLEMLLDSYIEDGALKSLSGSKPLQHFSLRCLLDPEVTLFNGPNAVLCHSPRILTPALESLDLGTMPCTDDDVECLLTYKTGLTTIDLSNTNITGASIKMLADNLPSLENIIADNCGRITGRDAIRYAERKGVAVSYQMGEQKGGRRIRY